MFTKSEENILVEVLWLIQKNKINKDMDSNNSWNHDNVSKNFKQKWTLLFLVHCLSLFTIDPLQHLQEIIKAKKIQPS